MKAIIWDEASQGMKFDYRDIPEEDARSAKRWSKPLLRSIEELMNKYLEEGDLTEAEIKGAMRQRTIAGEIADAVRYRLQEQGRAAMLDAVIEYLPSPVDIPGSGPERRRRAGRAKPRTTRSSPPWPSRSMTDPFVGQLTFIRATPAS
jgi:elongation factor G